MLSNNLLKFHQTHIFFLLQSTQYYNTRTFMQVDEALLKKLEKLSYLQIADDKREEIINQMSEIVSFVDNLSELNTDGVDDTFAMNDNSTFLREDTPECNADINDDILKNAPKSADHFFIVPKIIE